MVSHLGFRDIRDAGPGLEPDRLPSTTHHGSVYGVLQGWQAQGSIALLITANRRRLAGSWSAVCDPPLGTIRYAEALRKTVLHAVHEGLDVQSVGWRADCRCCPVHFPQSADRWTAAALMIGVPRAATTATANWWLHVTQRVDQHECAVALWIAKWAGGQHGVDARPLVALAGRPDPDPSSPRPQTVVHHVQ